VAVFTTSELRAGQGFRPPRCPHCGEALRQFALVVATRNCPRCGRRVVADPDGDGGPPPFTREEFAAGEVAHARGSSRACWVALVAFLAAAGGPLVLAVYRDTVREAVGTIIDPGWIALLLLLLPAAAGTAVGVAVYRRTMRTAPRCPHCSAIPYRFAQVVRATGNCPACGRRMLAGPPPEEPPGPLPTVAEFKVGVDRGRRRSDRLELVTSGGMVVAALVFAGLCSLGRPVYQRFSQEVEARHGVMGAAVAEVAAVLVLTLVFVGLFGACLYWVYRGEQRAWAADPAFECPHCRGRLSASSVVLASQRCPHCMRRVLAEPDGVAAGARTG
jgi:hypothetical protein